MATPTESRFSRLARLGGLTSRITSSYVGQTVANAFRSEEERRKAMDRAHVENAERVADTMSKLKGAAMKVGQQLAVAAASMDLPPEVAKALGKLHAEAEPVPFDVIRAEIEASLGKPLEQLFLSVDPQPLGTASLAQAHAGRLLDGRAVVIKVLHRGIAQHVSTDLMALKTALIAGRVLQRDRDELDTIFDELKERLEEELDYLKEAENIRAFSQVWSNHPDIQIPTVHPELSSERILTMDRLNGLPIDAFVAVATPEARQRAGHALGELYFKSAYRYRMLHADPHPGNYLFETDGRVGLLDFGCVKRFDEYWIARYCKAALAAVDGDREKCLTECRELGAWTGNNPVAGELLWKIVDLMGEPFRFKKYTVGGTADDILDRIPEHVKAVIQYPEVRTPRDLIMLHRSLMGMYSIARKLRVEADWGGMSRPQAQFAIDYANDWARSGTGSYQ